MKANIICGIIKLYTSYLSPRWAQTIEIAHWFYNIGLSIFMIIKDINDSVVVTNGILDRQHGYQL